MMIALLDHNDSVTSATAVLCAGLVLLLLLLLLYKLRHRHD
jgi:hypothetical protein